MNLTAIILDACLAVSVITLAARDYRRGFLQSVARTAGHLCACIVAFFGSRVLSEACYQLFFRDKLALSLENALVAASDSGDFSEKIARTLEALPGYIRRLLEAAGMGAEALQQRLAGSVQESAHQLSLILLETVVYPLLSALLQGISFLVLFSAAMVLVHCLVKALNGVKRMPLVGPVNAVLGGIMGVMEAAVLWVVIAVLLRLFLHMTGGFSWLNEGLIGESYLFGKLYQALGRWLPAVGLEV